ncbi:MAG: hypothetical protein KDI37_07965 [Xanthomonadales bacterium]|nr:hypothetical protein [Xanthomonadales bacterium]
MLARTYFVVVLLLGAGALHAQSTMTIDGSCTFQLATTGSAVDVNPNNGNVAVTSLNGINCSTGAPGVDLTLPTTAPINSSFQVSWNATGTTGSTPCTASGGGLSNWSAQGPLLSSGEVTVTAPNILATNVPFTITCTTASGTVQDTQTMSFNGEGPFVDLIATPSLASLGQSITLTWHSSGTTSATPCTPSGGGTTSWASLGPLAASGSTTVATTAVGQVTFALTCSTTIGPLSDQESVTVISEAPCAGITPPAGITAGAETLWQNFYGQLFPEPFNAQRQIGISQAVTRVFRFVAPAPGQIIVSQPVNPTLSLHYLSTTNPAFDAGVVTTISECPNDFRQSVLNTSTNRCYRGPGGLPAMSISLANSGAGFCNLTPGRTYYLNMHVGTSTTPDATGAFCTLPICTFVGGALNSFTDEPED